MTELLETQLLSKSQNNRIRRSSRLVTANKIVVKHYDQTLFSRFYIYVSEKLLFFFLNTYKELRKQGREGGRKFIFQQGSRALLEKRWRKKRHFFINGTIGISRDPV